MYSNSEPSNQLSTAIDELVTGFKAFFAGASTLMRHPSLLWLSLIPVVGTLVLIALVSVVSVWLVDLWLADLLITWKGIVLAIVFLIALFLGLSLYLPIARVLLAPFSEALCRKTIQVAGLGWIQFGRPNALRAIWEGLKLVTLQILVLAVGLLLSFVVPVVGHLLWLMTLVVLCGMDFLDVPLSARGLKLGEKLNLLWKYKFWAFGFGLAGYVMLFIPFVNLLALPVGIIGATLLTSRMKY